MATHKRTVDVKSLTDAVKAGHGAAILKKLEREQGIVFDEALRQQVGEQVFRVPGIAMPGMAMDAPVSYTQSELVTVTSAGIPYFLANWLDPKIIPILVSPMMAAVIAGEVLKGDWLTETAMFITAEAVGETSAYGDYSMSGASNVNVNFPQRQNFIFQSFMQYGQRELGRAGLAKIDWAAQQQSANALTLMKALNFLYFYGASGLQNYGLLNDPALPPQMTATYSWLSSSSATANTIYQDIVRMFIQLQSQTGGVVQVDTPMVLALSPPQSMALKFITTYNTNSVEQLLKENFPNLRIETAVQYGPPFSTSGQIVQLIAEEIEGQRSVECAFSTKLMAFNMIVAESSWRQKRASGGFGAIWYRPMAQVQMIA